MNQQPVIITVAITGAVPRKKDCPGLPVTPTEQIEETHKAYEAGASLVHIHVRNRMKRRVRILICLHKSKKVSRNTAPT